MMPNEAKFLDKSQLQNKVAIVVGTRPGIIMFAPVIKEMAEKNVEFILIHTGQHYSPNMDSQFFVDLKLPKPDYKLNNVKTYTTHGKQTAAMLSGVEEILLLERPKLILVGGDANTHLASALAARKLRIQVGHVEAGERSYDWRMPEEHNRRMIDHISDHLFTTNEKGAELLKKESVQGTIHITGNPIVDATNQHRLISQDKSKILEEWSLNENCFCVLTTHREENVDFPNILKSTLEGVAMAAQSLNCEVIFLSHPRTIKRINEFGLRSWVEKDLGIPIRQGLGYLDFLHVVASSKMIFTDSGGVQQEACIQKIPCVTLRENTEWTETLDIGANVLAGTTVDGIVTATEKILAGFNNDWEIPFGDGKAAKRIVEVVKTVVA